MKIYVLDLALWKACSGYPKEFDTHETFLRSLTWYYISTNTIPDTNDFICRPSDELKGNDGLLSRGYVIRAPDETYASKILIQRIMYHELKLAILPPAVIWQEAGTEEFYLHVSNKFLSEDTLGEFPNLYHKYRKKMSVEEFRVVFFNSRYIDPCICREHEVPDDFKNLNMELQQKIMMNVLVQHIQECLKKVVTDHPDVSLETQFIIIDEKTEESRGQIRKRLTFKQDEFIQQHKYLKHIEYANRGGLIKLTAEEVNRLGPAQRQIWVWLSEGNVNKMSEEPKLKAWLLNSIKRLHQLHFGNGYDTSAFWCLFDEFTIMELGKFWCCPPIATTLPGPEQPTLQHLNIVLGSKMIWQMTLYKSVELKAKAVRGGGGRSASGRGGGGRTKKIVNDFPPSTLLTINCIDDPFLLQYIEPKLQTFKFHENEKVRFIMDTDGQTHKIVSFMIEVCTALSLPFHEVWSYLTDSDNIVWDAKDKLIEYSKI